MVVLGALAAAGCGGDSDGGRLEGPAATVAPEPQTARGKLALAINEYTTTFTVSHRRIAIHVDTSEDGFEGTSPRGLDRDARRIFASVYRETPYRRATRIVFTGDLSGGAKRDVTVSYAISRRQAATVRWSDYRVLLKMRWGKYRT